MALLTDVDQPGSAIDRYVEKLDKILKIKMDGILELKVGVTDITVLARWLSHGVKIEIETTVRRIYYIPYMKLPMSRCMVVTEMAWAWSHVSGLSLTLYPCMQSKLERFKEHLKQEEIMSATVRPGQKGKW